MTNDGAATRVAVLLANGFEEIEAVTIVDVLRRAGLAVDTVGVNGANATGSHQITVACDVTLDALDASRVRALVLPGGMPGAQTLTDDARVQALVQAHAKKGRLLAAICAAPMALGRAGVLKGKRATCFPGFESELTGAVVDENARVVEDGAVITSRGPGTALEFSLALVRVLVDAPTSAKLRAGMLVESST
jgi:4-methyl-5(b-hydroxyethyl)-thiazole monophosphate biosynthesis